MSDAVTDTHGLIWYLEDSPRLGSEASKVFEACSSGEAIIYVPTICLVELVYLQEKGRIPADLMTQLHVELQAGTSDLMLADLTVDIVDTLVRVPRSVVPDMPDRIIAATALHLNLPLISRDRKIQCSSVLTIW
jgi:PIN domain nuclease of toxin-antitoxin system